jgi:SAM-dependent methyltransferase
MDIKYAKELVKKTKEDFSSIAKSFSESRSYLWPELEDLKQYIKDNEKVLDVGCGNGRLIELFGNNRVDYIGVDFSEKLIEKAKEKYGNHFQTADILSLPFSSDYFDSIWSIAVFHHIPSKELRTEALKEMRRILKKGGRIILTCWNLYQWRYLKLLLKFTFRKIFGLSKLDFKDILVPWKETRIQRYYHAFTKNELGKIFKENKFKIEELRFLKRNNKKTNILMIARKL